MFWWECCDARRIKNDSPEKAAERLERFLAAPPSRIAPERIASRRNKGIRKAKPSRLLDELCEAQHWKCAYCNNSMRRKADAHQEWRKATVEHVLPISRGGTNARSNVVAACTRCNTAKGSMTLDEFRAAQTPPCARSPVPAQDTSAIINTPAPGAEARAGTESSK